MGRATIGILFFVCQIIIGADALAFSCSPSQTRESQFEEADRVLFARLIRAELLEEEYEGRIISYVVGHYQTIETFKGPHRGGGSVIDVIGAGTGMAVLLPGLYYFFFISDSSQYQGMDYVNNCIAMKTLFPDHADTEALIAKLRELSGGTGVSE